MSSFVGSPFLFLARDTGRRRLFFVLVFLATFRLLPATERLRLRVEVRFVRLRVEARFLRLQVHVARRLRLRGEADVVRLRFRPPPESLPIRFCVACPKCLVTMSRVLMSAEVLSAISDKIRPPVRIASLPSAFSVTRPKSLAPLHRRGLTKRKIPPKKLPIPRPFCINGGIAYTGPIELLPRLEPRPAWCK